MRIDSQPTHLNTHQPFENLPDRQIKKARAQTKSEGPGVPIEKIPRHTIRMEQRQPNHF